MNKALTPRSAKALGKAVASARSHPMHRAKVRGRATAMALARRDYVVIIDSGSANVKVRVTEAGFQAYDAGLRIKLTLSPYQYNLAKLPPVGSIVTFDGRRSNIAWTVVEYEPKGVPQRVWATLVDPTGTKCHLVMSGPSAPEIVSVSLPTDVL